MAITLFDVPDIRNQLLPLTFTRPLAEMRVGIFKISEKWEKRTGRKAGWLTEPYLSKKYPCSEAPSDLNINGALCPDERVLAAIQSLKENTALTKNDLLLAFRSSKKLSYDTLGSLLFESSEEYPGEPTLIDRPWKIFQYNGKQIIEDISLVSNALTIQDPFTRVYCPENVYLAEGAKVKAAILNAENGPIFLGKNSEVREGAIIRGPFALGEKSVVNLGAKIVGDTTVGPCSKVGGEISNSVIFGYSNKAHDGFLGNSVVGEWCNVGADTNTSNLKNNYQKVKLWSYAAEDLADTGLQFCGLIMGDHAKCGINTMFNTGTVAGVGANVFGEGFPPNFIPSFSWGGASGFSTFRWEKFLEMTIVVMQRRLLELSDIDREILETVFNLTNKFRNWET